MTPEENYKKLFKPLRLSMYDFNENSVRKELETLVDSNAIIHLSFPLNDTVGPDAFYDLSYKKLFHSFPDLERRDYIVISGRTEKNFYWVRRVARVARGCGDRVTDDTACRRLTSRLRGANSRPAWKAGTDYYNQPQCFGRPRGNRRP